jgi:hypothetical protein
MKMEYIVSTILMSIFIYTTQTNAEDTHNKGTWKTDGEIRYTYAHYDGVKCLALEIRDVPIHVNDGYASRKDGGPIEETGNSFHSVWGFGFEKKYYFTEDFSLGLGLDWTIAPTFLDIKKRRNYTNHVGTETRGYGAALTCIGMGRRGVFKPMRHGGWWNIFTNISPKISAEYVLIPKKLSIGTYVTYHAIEAINGWDRWDSIEIYKTFTLSHNMPIGMYISIYDHEHIGIKVGAEYVKRWATPIGIESGISEGGFALFVSQHY